MNDAAMKKLAAMRVANGRRPAKGPGIPNTKPMMPTVQNKPVAPMNKPLAVPMMQTKPAYNKKGY